MQNCNHKLHEIYEQTLTNIFKPVIKYLLIGLILKVGFELYDHINKFFCVSGVNIQLGMTMELVEYKVIIKFWFFKTIHHKILEMMVVYGPDFLSYSIIK